MIIQLLKNHCRNLLRYISGLLMENHLKINGSFKKEFFKFSAVLGLPCCLSLSLVAVNGGYSVVGMSRLQCLYLSNCGSQALGHRLNGCGAQA